MAPVPIKRGDYVWPHMAQVLRRDLHGEKIIRNYGKVAHAYRVDHNIENSPYDFILKSPESSALSWCAFEDKATFGKFLAAYDLSLCLHPSGPTLDLPTIDMDGEWFYVALPTDDHNFQPVNTDDWNFAWLTPTPSAEYLTPDGDTVLYAIGPNVDSDSEGMHP